MSDVRGICIPKTGYHREVRVNDRLVVMIMQMMVRVSSWSALFGFGDVRWSLCWPQAINRKSGALVGASVMIGGTKINTGDGDSGSDCTSHLGDSNCGGGDGAHVDIVVGGEDGRLRAGDIIMGDSDGLIVIPQVKFKLALCLCVHARILARAFQECEDSLFEGLDGFIEGLSLHASSMSPVIAPHSCACQAMARLGRSRPSRSKRASPSRMYFP